MIEIQIPGFGILQAEHLVLDYNGTLALDGRPLTGVKEALEELSHHLTIHILTADTFGRVAKEMEGVPCILSIIGPDRQDEAKGAYVKRLGADRCVCIGNGRNDALMLWTSRLGIAVILEEGASAETIRAAKVVCTDILSALNLLRRPLRLTATMRT